MCGVAPWMSQARGVFVVADILVIGPKFETPALG
jgi:hypothetical protein